MARRQESYRRRSGGQGVGCGKWSGAHDEDCDKEVGEEEECVQVARRIVENLLHLPRRQAHPRSGVVKRRKPSNRRQAHAAAVAKAPLHPLHPSSPKCRLRAPTRSLAVVRRGWVCPSGGLRSPRADVKIAKEGTAEREDGGEVRVVAVHRVAELHVEHHAKGEHGDGECDHEEDHVESASL